MPSILSQLVLKEALTFSDVKVVYLALEVFVVYVLVKCTYNRYFHPLANFPGPFFGSLTDWYFVYMITSIPTIGMDLHKKYGPVIRLAPNLLSFSDPELLPVVYNRHADKPDLYGSWMFGNTAAIFQSLKHEDHVAKKRRVATCCSMTTMKAHHERKICERVDELCQNIEERSSRTKQPVDFSEHLEWFLSDTWSHLVYGKPLGCVDQGKDVKGLLAALQGVYSMSAVAAIMPRLMHLLRNSWLRENIWCYTKTFKNINTLCTNFDNMLDRRYTNAHFKEEVLFFDSLDPKKTLNGFQYSREDLKAETIIFEAANLDGVAAFISPFIDNLIQHPTIHARVVAEIAAADSVGSLSRPVATYDETITALPFFTACVKETLRHDAIAQIILPRLVPAAGYIMPDGKFVPGGVQMGASAYVVHRDESVFGPDADQFRPGRWMPGEGHPRATEANIKRMERLGMWWGYGDRECAGKNYAQMLVHKLCVELLRRFEISYPGGRRFHYERWAVSMFRDQKLHFDRRA